jgi:tetratricopeptide (TPR) repeat protein
MARKRSRNRKNRAGARKPRASLTQDQLEDRGIRLLAAGRFREAVADFKGLLQQERRPAWVESLAAAYAGRARGLADKGMFREALVIWRNRAETCKLPLADLAYFELLFQTGQIEPALKLIREERAFIEQQGLLPGLRELCAVQVLAGDEEILDAFPADDPLKGDTPAALAALQAWCRGEDAVMEQQLKSIPFRSPFRDFRQILKALSLLERDVTGAMRLLDRVDSGSPFSVLCAAVRSSRLSEVEFMQRYRTMGTAERCLGAAFRGWSPRQIHLVQELNQLGESPDADTLLRFLLRHREDLGEAYVRETGMRFPVPLQVKTGYTKVFGPQSPFDRARIEALRLEEEGAPTHPIFNAWREACLALGYPDLDPHLDTASTLTLALVLRRMVEHWLATEPPNKNVLAALKGSLHYDPDDLPTYLLLIRLYREQHQLKEARQLLDEALSRYPEDTRVLTEAVETALAGDAFKKAARFARRTLELDPINPRVREVLVNSHMAHARKQIRQGKIPLARGELDQALDWARTEPDKGRVDLVRGIMELGEHNIQAARALFSCGFERTGGGLVGRLFLLLETGRMDRDLAYIIKQAQLPKPARKTSREQALALVHALNEVRDEDKALLIQAVEFMEGSLKSAARLEYTLPESELICETWLRLEQDDLRSRYARAALKRWPGTPVFVFHWIDAGHRPFDPMSPKDCQALETAFKRAREDGDMRSAHRIGDLLDGSMPFVAPGNAAFNPFGTAGLPGAGEAADMEALLDFLMNNEGPPDVEAMKRELGPEGMLGLLAAMLRGESVPDDLDELLPGASRPKPRKRTRNKARKQDQFDLF